MFNQAGRGINIRARGDIIFLFELLEGLIIEFKALPKAAERETKSFFVKAIRAAEEATGGKWPAILVIASFKESVFV